MMSGQTGVLDHKFIADDTVFVHRAGVTEGYYRSRNVCRYTRATVEKVRQAVRADEATRSPGKAP